VPSASACGAVVLQAPPPPTGTPDSVWSGEPVAPGPLKIWTVTVLASPTSTPAVPVIAGVVSAVEEPCAGEAIETTGLTRSPWRMKSTLSVAMCPATSDCSTSSV
jgi:hypothetical protein